MRKINLVVIILISFLLVWCTTKMENPKDISVNGYPIETFVSKRLWVKFNFIDQPLFSPMPNLILSGDSIIVWPHTLTIMKKNINISAEKFIKSLMSGVKEDCIFEVKIDSINSPFMSWYEEIVVQNKSPRNFLWRWDNNTDNHCSNKYTSEFWLNEFIYNPKFPGKIIFLEIWQDTSLRGTEELPRFRTINIF